MLFDRRLKRKESGPRNSRAEYRHALPPDHPLRMQLVRADGSVLDVLPVDLTARGAGFRTWTDVTLYEEEVFDVLITSDEDGWTVRTPGMIRHGIEDGDAIDWGLEFINQGNLYGQWDNVLGRYFNRRQHRRVTPELDRKIAVQLERGERAASGSIHDISSYGMGLVVRKSEVSGVERDDRVVVDFRLPRYRRPIRGEAVVRQVRTSGATLFLGLEFDLENPEGIVSHQRAISGYCDRLASDLANWESDWRGAA